MLIKIIDLSSGDNMKEEELTASESTDRARLTLYLGQNERDTEITINSLKLYKVKGNIGGQPLTKGKTE